MSDDELMPSSQRSRHCTHPSASLTRHTRPHRSGAKCCPAWAPPGGLSYFQSLVFFSSSSRRYPRGWEKLVGHKNSFRRRGFRTSLYETRNGLDDMSPLLCKRG